MKSQSPGGSYLTSISKFCKVKTNKRLIGTYVASIWKHCTNIDFQHTHLPVSCETKCPAHIQQVYISPQYLYSVVSPPVFPAANPSEQNNKGTFWIIIVLRKRKTKHWKHLGSREATAGASHCFFFLPSAFRPHSCH